MSKTVAEAKAERMADLVCMAQILVRTRGPHEDQALVGAIDFAIKNVCEMLPFITALERSGMAIELYRRYGVA